MPLIVQSSYKKPPFYLPNKHFETIIPALFRRIKDVHYQRERIKTPDDDFLDLDWSKVTSKKLAVISHGLEGNSTRPYMKGMVRTFNSAGYDALAWNYRGCSEEMNKQKRFYHSGATDDLEVIIKHVSDQSYYDTIILVGFSLGGNITLKYLGEKGENVPKAIQRAIAFSVPLNLHTSCIKISEPSNFLYSRRFLNNLKSKVIIKSRLMPTEFKINGLKKIKTIREFDEHYTAPLHGFQNALHYYESCSSINFLKGITIPSLIVNAENDPFLSLDCYPEDELRSHPCVYFEKPKKGGHVGFSSGSDNGAYWSELRAVEFAEKAI
ncbi:alpha/beta fold hydrolase [Fulvivirgaceae bacterium BMA10]|uniref:Alpha/beta fold hydrolase n=1 Tax=Splendidivirga corallicola TaxID=3051826 RepID=A0ABT8KQE8_9BACT|nr:alpha/beta fold hydrolase [Fulvivirgaceae bacterium BMA10]